MNIEDAVIYNNFERVTELLPQEENLGRLLQLAGSLEMTRYLVEHKADVEYRNENGDTALRHAVIMDNYYIAEYLISRGANVNIKNKVGSSYLH